MILDGCFRLNLHVCISFIKRRGAFHLRSFISTISCSFEPSLPHSNSVSFVPHSREHSASHIASLLQSCSALTDLHFGRKVHSQVITYGLSSSSHVCSKILGMYILCGSFCDATSMFYRMELQHSLPWNWMIRVCAVEGIITLGSQLHGLSVILGFEKDPPVANTLVAVYSKFQQLLDACKIFEAMPQNDVVLWNAIISGHVQNGMMREAFDLFDEMIDLHNEPDSVTFSSLLPSISQCGTLKHGKEVHGYILRHEIALDVYLKSALIDLYCKCRDVKMARRIFEETSLADTAIYTGLISGYVLNGMSTDAVETFRELVDEGIYPNSLTLASLLPACANLASVKLGKEVHAFALRNGIEAQCYVGSALLDMYAKCGRLDLARNIFINISQKDAVCWNSMITGYSQNGKPEEAIHHFRQMGAVEGIRYDSVSLTSTLSACASLPALYHGKQIHGYMVKHPHCSDVFGKSTLIDMYAK
ncbi:hypothetical protein SAY86_024651, partial [Trapa natans]